MIGPLRHWGRACRVHLNSPVATQRRWYSLRQEGAILKPEICIQAVLRQERMNLLGFILTSTHDGCVVSGAFVLYKNVFVEESKV
jgi:hypothetical protein